MADRHIDGPDAFAAAFSVSRETCDRLVAYAELLRTWQRAVNLVAPSTIDDVWHRHMADSAQLVSIALEVVSAFGESDPGSSATTPRRWLDIGSGAGFPGMVAAIMIAGAPGVGTWRFSLVESDQRKCAFLREVARVTGLSAPSGNVMSVDILGARIEKLATRDTVERAHVVSARALAPLEALLAYARPLLGGGPGIAVFPKGKDVASEIDMARRRWLFEARLVPSVTDPAARIVVIEALQPREEDNSQ
jgi:16S rRNA (guanine527-N7)-methyltransferase